MTKIGRVALATTAARTVVVSKGATAVAVKGAAVLAGASLGTIALAAIAVVVVGVVAYNVLKTDVLVGQPAPYPEAPYVVGMDYRDAARELEAEGFIPAPPEISPLYGTITYRECLREDEEIVAQNQDGWIVHLFCQGLFPDEETGSTEEPPVEYVVPDVEGLPKEDALRELVPLGFNVSSGISDACEEARDETAAQWYVHDQSPGAGATISSGDTVILYLCPVLEEPAPVPPEAPPVTEPVQSSGGRFPSLSPGMTCADFEPDGLAYPGGLLPAGFHVGMYYYIVNDDGSIYPYGITAQDEPTGAYACIGGDYYNNLLFGWTIEADTPVLANDPDDQEATAAFMGLFTFLKDTLESWGFDCITNDNPFNAVNCLNTSGALVNFEIDNTYPTNWAHIWVMIYYAPYGVE